VSHSDHPFEQREAPAPTPAADTVRQTFAAGLAEHRAGRLDQAERLYRQVLAADRRHPDSLHLLGVIASQAGRHEVALDLIGEAIALAPDTAVYHMNLGNALLALGRPEAAERCHLQAIALDPDLEEAHLNLGNALRDQRAFDTALVSYRKAAALKPDRAETHDKLGAVLLLLGQPEAALAHLQTAVRLRPDFAEAHSNLAVAHARLQQPQNAVAACRAAIRLRPDYAEAHNNLAMALLSSGDMAAGWPEYEWRWQVEPGLAARQDFRQPQWMGEPGEGRSIFIHHEQGFGDTIQFCRYAPLVRARGLRVAIGAPLPLVRLLRGLDGVDTLVAPGDALPPFELHCPMLGLPRALGTTVETVPAAIPYLHAEAAQAAAWRARLAHLDGAGPRIGLAWAGFRHHGDLPFMAAVDRQRSLAPAQLAPLLTIPGLQFFSLQKTGAKASADFPLTDVMDEMRDFADTAALVANLDLVISVDTAVAHLAGALGRPVWLLDRFGHCWRWLTGRRDSPWYPTMRIYRQPRPGDWDAVLADVAADVHRLVEAWQAFFAALPADTQAT